MPAIALRLLGASLALALAAPAAVAAPAKAGKPGKPGKTALPNDLRPALKKLKAAKATEGPQDIHVLEDGSRIVLTLAGGMPVAWSLARAKGTPDAAINFDRAPNPKDRQQCALLLARAAFTVEYVVDCAFVPPLPGR
jgi:hypothetical protein